MQDNTERLFFLDAARALLMILGIILHSAQIFSPESNWLVQSNSNNVTYLFIIETLHTFRMPAFFIISGFFCLFTLKKYGSSKFINIRVRRIVIPFLVTVITLNTFQETILHQNYWHFNYFVSYIKHGKWLSHLWFLVYLMIYFLFVAVSYSVLKNRIKKAIDTRLTNSNLLLYSAILIFPFSHIAILSLNKIGVSIYTKIGGIVDVYKLLIYFTFFLFGILLASRNNILLRFSSINPKYSVSTIFLAALVYQIPLNSLPDNLLKVITSYFESLSTLMMTSLLFLVFLKYFNKPSKNVAALADASYTIYLFHHLFVVAFGLLVIKYNIEHEVGFPLIVTSVFLITLLIHRKIIIKNKVLHFLFNGK